jgi:hypothetical protein
MCFVWSTALSVVRMRQLLSQSIRQPNIQGLYNRPEWLALNSGIDFASKSVYPEGRFKEMFTSFY